MSKVKSFKKKLGADKTAPDSKQKKKPRIFSFSVKLMLFCLVPMIVVSISIIKISSDAMKDKVEKQIEEALKIVTASLSGTYDTMYVGDYSKTKSGAITKGGIKINGDYDLFDYIKEQSGYESSFVFGDMRISTTILRKGGGRIVGSNIDKDIYEKTLKGKGVFRRNVEIQDVKYYAYYMPLYNSDGNVCGVMESAKPAAEVQSMIKDARKQVMEISVIILIISMILALLITTSMARAMRKTKQYLEVIANGDLSKDGDSKLMQRNDELGDIYQMSVKLKQEFRNIVTDIMESVGHLADAADSLTKMAQETRLTVDEVYASVEIISEGANTQAENTTSVSDNVSKIGEQIEYISNEVDSLTAEAGRMAEAGEQSEHIIKELNISNDETIASITKVAEQINATNTAIMGIQDAAAMIQSISEETDLLSLNASIEAARAGDAGRGFAVVAEQITKLADQSNAAAIEIGDIITQITGESHKMVQIMDIVKSNVDEQQQKLTETKNKFNVVALGVDASRNNINGIQEKMGVLEDSSTAILSVVEQLSSISEENVASTEDTMSSAQNMTDTMEQLENSSNALRELAGRLEASMNIFKM